MPCEFMAMAAARTGSFGSQLLLHARRIGRLCRPAYKSDRAWTVWSSSTWDWMVNCASPRELAGCVEQGIVSCPSVVRVELETEWKKREKRGEERQETQESGESEFSSAHKSSPREWASFASEATTVSRCASTSAAPYAQERPSVEKSIVVAAVSTPNAREASRGA